MSTLLLRRFRFRMPTLLLRRFRVALRAGGVKQGCVSSTAETSQARNRSHSDSDSWRPTHVSPWRVSCDCYALHPFPNSFPCGLLLPPCQVCARRMLHSSSCRLPLRKRTNRLSGQQVPRGRALPRPAMVRLGWADAQLSTTRRRASAWRVGGGYGGVSIPPRWRSQTSTRSRSPIH